MNYKIHSVEDTASLKTKFWWVTRNILFPLSGVLLLFITFKDKDFGNIWEAVLQANLVWFILPRFLLLFSHWFRAWRWVIQLRTFGYKISVITAFNAVMATYLVNIFLPQIGDFYRSWALNKTDSIPVSRSIGTIVIEKIIDLGVVIFFFILGASLTWGKVSFFIKDVLLNNLMSKLMQSHSWTSIILLISILLVFTIILSKTNIFGKKLKSIFRNVWQGIISVKKVENKFAFVSLSFLVFISTWMSFHLCFLAMAKTSNLGIDDSMFVFSSAALGQLAPIQGSLGAFHWMVTNSLSLLSVNPELALAFATAVHATGIVFRIVFGLVGMFYLKQRGVKLEELTKKANSEIES